MFICLFLSMFTTWVPAKNIRSHPILSGGIYYEIPFEYTMGGIIIKVESGHNNYRFMFDTGGYTMVTSEFIENNRNSVHLKPDLSVANRLGDIGETVIIDTLSLSGLVFKDVPAYHLRLDKSPTLGCMINGGIIGVDIIKNYIWQIDFTRSVIIVTDKMAQVTGLTNAIRLPVSLNSQAQPYIMFTVNGKGQWVMFDTGCTSLLRMGEKDAKKYREERFEIIGGGVETFSGYKEEVTTVFKGNYKSGKLIIADSPVFSSASSPLTLLGNPILKKYIVTLNFSKNEIFFSPIQEYEDEQGWSSFGISLYFNNGQYKVRTLLRGSAADHSGIAVGDQVLSINGQVPDCSNYCECLQYFENLFEESDQLDLVLDKPLGPQNKVLKKDKIF